MVKKNCPLLTAKITFTELAEECELTPQELWDVILGLETIPVAAKKLSEWTGMSVPSFYKPTQRTRNCFLEWMAFNINVQSRHLRVILQQKATAGKKAAIALEQFTGIPKIAWIFPEQNSNWMMEAISRKGSE
jgi:hypothetical protein